MKKPMIDDKDVVAVIFDKSVYRFRTVVDDWMWMNGYDPDMYHCEESEKSYRLMLAGPHLGCYEQSSLERRPADVDGITYVLGRVVEPLKFQTDLDPQALGDGLGEWFQILYTGQFKKYGHEFEITDQVLDTMVSNFNKNVLKKQHLPIDYSHDNHQKAAGWITELKLGDDKKTLFAKAQWTPAGKKALLDREFSYFSAEFVLSHFDAETGLEHGPVLRGGGLTNIPFLKLPPIIPLHEDGRELSAIFFEEENKMDPVKLAEVQKQVEHLTAERDAMKTQVAKLTEDLSKFGDIAVRFTQLETQNKELDAQLKLSRKNDEFNKLLSEGRACEAQRNAFVTENFAEYAAKAEKVNIVTPPKGNEGSEKVVLNDNERDFYERNMKPRGVTEEQYIAMSRDKNYSFSHLTPAPIEGGAK